MIAGQILGLGFIILSMVGVSSYTDDLAMIRLPFFYKELQPMQERWGKEVGTILHIIEYVIIPLGFGLLFLRGLVF